MMRTFRMFAGYAGYAGLMVISLLPAYSSGAEGAFNQLYAARAPADSSFVRVVSVAQEPVDVQIAGAALQKVTPFSPSTSYAIVKGNEDFYIRLNHKRSSPMTVLPGTFHTLIVKSGDQPEPWSRIDDTRKDVDALKVTIHFYNLNDDCQQGRLNVEPQGPVLIKDVHPLSWSARAVNPVSAKLSGACLEVKTNDIELPELRGGDHFSVFLSGSGIAPRIIGQVNGVDPYKP